MSLRKNATGEWLILCEMRKAHQDCAAHRQAVLCAVHWSVTGLDRALVTPGGGVAEVY